MMRNVGLSMLVFLIVFMAMLALSSCSVIYPKNMMHINVHHVYNGMLIDRDSYKQVLFYHDGLYLGDMGNEVWYSLEYWNTGVEAIYSQKFSILHYDMVARRFTIYDLSPGESDGESSKDLERLIHILDNNIKSN